MEPMKKKFLIVRENKVSAKRPERVGSFVV